MWLSRGVAVVDMWLEGVKCHLPVSDGGGGGGSRVDRPMTFRLGWWGGGEGGVILYDALNMQIFTNGK